ncbi:MAG: hypothetical protein MZW92_46375 [Comamonadaceae bacterium]|nr:hypothetical protein [Comamonadaceae bacterium]
MRIGYNAGTPVSISNNSPQRRKVARGFGTLKDKAGFFVALCVFAPLR